MPTINEYIPCTQFHTPEVNVQLTTTASDPWLSLYNARNTSEQNYKNLIPRNFHTNYFPVCLSSGITMCQQEREPPPNFDTTAPTSLWFDDHGIEQSFPSNNGSERWVKRREFPLEDGLQSCSILSKSLLLNHLGEGRSGWEEEGWGVGKGLLLEYIFEI